MTRSEILSCCEAGSEVLEGAVSRAPSPVRDVENALDTADSIKKSGISDEGTALTLMNSR